LRWLMAKKKIDIPTVYIRNGIIVFFLLFVALAVYRNCMDFLKTSSLFRVKSVTTSADVQFLQPRVLRQLQGQNIFAVDLKHVHNEIRALYPQIYDLHIERRFPDTMHVAARKRDAYAQVLVKQNYLTIDNDGIVIFVDKKPLPQLILIKSSKLDKFKIFLGTKINTPEVLAGLDTIQAFKSNPGLSKYPISNIDSDNLSKITFSIGTELQIIIDRDDIAKKLDTLSFLIAQKKLNFLEVKYIDLRFKEPIVGKK
jgi:cell division septal protein FtsQ